MIYIWCYQPVSRILNPWKSNLSYEVGAQNVFGESGPWNLFHSSPPGATCEAEDECAPMLIPNTCAARPQRTWVEWISACMMNESVLWQKNFIVFHRLLVNGVDFHTTQNLLLNFETCDHWSQVPGEAESCWTYVCIPMNSSPWHAGSNGPWYPYIITQKPSCTQDNAPWLYTGKISHVTLENGVSYQSPSVINHIKEWQVYLMNPINCSHASQPYAATNQWLLMIFLVPSFTTHQIL